MRSFPLFSRPIHFKQWLGLPNEQPPSLIQNECSEAYATYLIQPGPPGNVSMYSAEVVKCLLDGVGTALQANYSTAAVLLGLLPTVLGMAASTTTEVGLVAMRRPLLGFLVAAGCPFLPITRSFEPIEPEKIFERRPYMMIFHQVSGKRATFITSLQYFLVTVALGNLYYTIYEITVKSVFAGASETIIHPGLWGASVLVVYILGTYVTSLRCRFVGVENKNNAKRNIMYWMKRETCPAIGQQDDSVHLLLKRETYRSAFLSWLATTLLVMHAIYGTTLLSGTLFVSTMFAVQIMGRFLSSVLVCRAIVVFELRCMQRVLSIGDQDVTDCNIPARLRRAPTLPEMSVETDKGPIVTIS